MKEKKHTLQELKMRQALPLEAKVAMTKLRIREWVNEFGIDGVYVSFSGGKDSTVLLHLARQIYPDMVAMFIDTGLEYPEIRDFVKTFENVDWIRPKMNFKQVIDKYGYPFISKEVSHCIYESRNFLENPEKYKDRKPINVQKPTDKYKPYSLLKLDGSLEHNGEKSMFCMDNWKPLLNAPFHVSDQCCNVMKKKPAHEYHRKTGRFPITAQMASESRLRLATWLSNGCNAFNAKHKVSNPMSFWTEQDVLKYIKENNLEICSVYGNIVPVYKDREEFEGQVDFCDLGLIDDNRRYKTTCLSRTGCMFCGFGCHHDKEGQGRFEKMKETHPKQYDFIMKPTNRGGLNYKEIIDWLNENCHLDIKY